ncbi:MAG: hypothetical protein ACYSR6_12210 [Planctomycetota bacterium]
MKSTLTILLIITVISIEAPYQPAYSSEGPGDELAWMVLGTGAVLTGFLSGTFALANRDLIKKDKGNAVLGSFGVLAGIPTVMLGGTIVYVDLGDDTESAISGWSLVGLTVGVVGMSSIVYGIRSIRESSRGPDASESKLRSVTPAVFGDGRQFSVGVQLTIRF